MFGRLRPPPSTPDSLERYPAKILKDDPLSVYEATLLKLKQGSRVDISLETEVENLSSSSDLCSETQPAARDAMVIDLGSGQCQQQLKNKSPSVLSMFSSYKKAHSLDITPPTENAS